MAVIVLPAAVAYVVALCLALAPVTSAIGTLSSAASTTEKIAADVKADIAKHKHKKPHAAASSLPAK